MLVDMKNIKPSDYFLAFAAVCFVCFVISLGMAAGFWVAMTVACAAIGTGSYSLSAMYHKTGK
jgi:hypothetical protein